MNIYLVSQSVNNGYDTWSEFVCAAENEEDARDMHPNGHGPIAWDAPNGSHRSSWARKRDDVEVELLGTASEGRKEGVITSSFHAR